MWNVCVGFECAFWPRKRSPVPWKNPWPFLWHQRANYYIRRVLKLISRSKNGDSSIFLKQKTFSLCYLQTQETWYISFSPLICRRAVPYTEALDRIAACLVSEMRESTKKHCARGNWIPKMSRGQEKWRKGRKMVEKEQNPLLDVKQMAEPCGQRSIRAS